MNFPLDTSDRIVLTEIANTLSSLGSRASGMGFEYLAVLIQHATEEAAERLSDDSKARRERGAVVSIKRSMVGSSSG